MSADERDNRLRNFAIFFKSYMGVMPLITAGVAPLLTLSKAIPVFDSDRKALATLSGLLGFLIVAWIFYARNMFVPAMVPIHEPSLAGEGEDARDYAWSVRRRNRARVRTTNLLPLCLIVLSVLSYVGYTFILDQVIGERLGQKLPGNGDSALTVQQVLQRQGTYYPIDNDGLLQVFYLGIFLFAEAAFVVMALREYAYGVLKISEASVLRESDAPSQSGEGPPPAEVPSGLSTR